MATAKLNPVIKSISGRFGNAVFYTRGNTQCVRTYVIPKNPDTALQREMRRSFASAVKSWQTLTQEEKYVYTRKARNLGMSGYNLFISAYMTGKMIRLKNINSAFSKAPYSADTTQQNHCKQTYRIHSVSKPFLIKKAMKHINLKKSWTSIQERTLLIL